MYEAFWLRKIELKAETCVSRKPTNWCQSFTWSGLIHSQAASDHSGVHEERRLLIKNTNIARTGYIAHILVCTWYVNIIFCSSQPTLLSFQAGYIIYLSATSTQTLRSFFFFLLQNNAFFRWTESVETDEMNQVIWRVANFCSQCPKSSFGLGLDFRQWKFQTFPNQFSSNLELNFKFSFKTKFELNFKFNSFFSPTKYCLVWMNWISVDSN